ncbi:MAG: hypothetical protein ACT4PL_01640, partial [Phycisphaerales bacterium]
MRRSTARQYRSCLPCPTLIALAGVLLSVGSANGQSFTLLPAMPPDVAALPPYVRAPVGSVARIDWGALRDDLAAAAAVPGGESAPPSLYHTLRLPTPSGLMTAYRIVESPRMEPALAAKFPAIKTYRILGIDDSTAVGRVDVTSHGFRGMILTGSGMIFIDPVSGGEREQV